MTNPHTDRRPGRSYRRGAHASAHSFGETQRTTAHPSARIPARRALDAARTTSYFRGLEADQRERDESAGSSARALRWLRARASHQADPPPQVRETAGQSQLARPSGKGGAGPVRGRHYRGSRRKASRTIMVASTRLAWIDRRSESTRSPEECRSVIPNSRNAIWS